MTQRLTAALVAALTVFGGVGMYQGEQVRSDPEARADPFTGTMATTMETRISEAHAQDVAALPAHHETEMAELRLSQRTTPIPCVPSMIFTMTGAPPTASTNPAALPLG